MSKVKCMRCDKCGELIIGDDPHGTFRGALWPSEIESFDLCRDCSVEVQRFIHGRNEVKAHEDQEHDQGDWEVQNAVMHQVHAFELQAFQRHDDLLRMPGVPRLHGANERRDLAIAESRLVRGARWCRFEQKPPKAEDGDES